MFTNAQVALLASALTSRQADDTWLTDSVMRRAEMFMRWLDRQTPPEPDAVELPAPLVDREESFCDVCGHPWGYHHSPDGCSMPVIPGTTTPAMQRDVYRACACTITGRVRDDA